MLSNHPSVLGSGAAGVTTPAAASAALDLISTTQGAVLYRNATAWVALTPGTAGQLLSTQGAAANPSWVSATGGAGNVSSGAATDNAIVRYDGISGETVQNSAVTIADTTGAMTWSNAGGYLDLGASSLTATAVNTGGLRSANFGLSTVSGGASYFGGRIDYAGDTRYGVAKVYTAATGDMFGMEQVSAIQTGTQGMLRLFTSALNGSHITFGKYTSATAFTEWGRFDAAGFFNVNLSTPASNSYTGALVVGNGSSGSASVNVAIGGGNINAGGTIISGVQIQSATSANGSAVNTAFSLRNSAGASPNNVLPSLLWDSSSLNWARIDATRAASGGFGGALRFWTAETSAGTETLRLSIDSAGAATFAGAVTTQGLFYPQQATTAGAPAYVKGAIYFDTTLNKLRVGGATAWETITSV